LELLAVTSLSCRGDTGRATGRTGSLTRSAGSTMVTCPVSTTCLGRSEGWEA